MQQHDLIPLAALISKEMKNEKMGKPTVKYGHAAQSKKGEDYFLVKTDCQRVPGNSASTFSVYAVCISPCHFSYCCNKQFPDLLPFEGYIRKSICN